MKKIHQLLTNVWYYVLRKGRKTNKRKIKKGRDDIMKAITLSNYIIEKFNEQNSPISNLKLQKVLYYVQGYSLKMFDEPAFREEICNWHYGPVVPMVYYEFNGNGAGPLIPQGEVLDLLDAEKSKMIADVVEKCKNYRPSQLVAKTHMEDPWKDTKEGEVISQHSMKKYFLRNNPLEITI